MPTTIKATPENAPLLRKLIADWPELAQTIDSLRKQGMFPGLRCMTLTIDDDQNQTEADRGDKATRS